MESEAEMNESAMGGPVVVPEGTREKLDISYGSDPAQRMDVFLPPQAKDAPVLFMVHGGAWMWGDKRHSGIINNKAGRWLPKGYIFVTVNYRLSPTADPKGQVDDVATALAKAQSEAGAWGGDPNRFLLMGHSAGAHLVSLLASDPAIAAARGAKPWLGTIALDSAAYDVVRIMERRHFRFYDRVFRDDPAFWRDTSPLHRLRSKPAPFLAVCSSERSDSCPQAQAFVDKVNSLGGRAAIAPIAMGHGELNRELGLPGEYTDKVEGFMKSLGLP
jgi:arylformamidase